MDVAKRHQAKLDQMKDLVKKGHDYFKSNYERYNRFRKFIFESSLTPDEISLLDSIGRPQLEFNVLEAYLSRLIGEFYKQEPDIEVSARDAMSADPLIIQMVEQHLRHFFGDDNNEHTRFEAYKQILSGGFCVFKIYTEYAHPMSFDQVIGIKLCQPTMCVFDINARLPHKGDGRWACEIYPYTEEQFKTEFPDEKLKSISFSRQLAGFNWSYSSGGENIVLVAEYFSKVTKNVKVLRLSDGQVMTQKDYEKMEAGWNRFEQIPMPVGKTKWAPIDHIDRYRFIENKVISFEETDFSMLPLVFGDGNSALIQGSNNGSIHQMTRPYVYHAHGAQRLKNFAGISLANEIENIIQHKFIVKKEAIPDQEEFKTALKDVQRASTVVVNGFYQDNPNIPIPEPIREIARIGAPPEIMQAFSTTDQVIQMELGSYDSSLGINNNQLSGIAVIESATQSNAAAMPYVIGLMQGLQRCAEIYIDLMPKYYVTPRTLPVMDAEGKRGYVMINDPNGKIHMDYDPQTLNVSLKAGASFQVQKSRTIMMVKEMMGMSPLFAQFISEKGLNFVLENMEGKGVDQLKQMVDEWTKELEQQKQMAQAKVQQEIQNNPAVMRNKIMADQLELDKQKAQQDFVVDLIKVKQENEKNMVQLNETQANNQNTKLRTAAEVLTKQIDAQLKEKDQVHRHFQEAADLHHRVSRKENVNGQDYME